MMEHFFNSDYKVLCCSISELSQNIGSLSKEQLEELRQLPSFRHYVDSLPKKEKAPLLLDDCLFKVSEVSNYKKSLADTHRYVVYPVMWYLLLLVAVLHMHSNLGGGVYFRSCCKSIKTKFCLLSSPGNNMIRYTFCGQDLNPSRDIRYCCLNCAA